RRGVALSVVGGKGGLGVPQPLAPVVGEDQRLVLPAHAGLVVDRQARVTLLLPADTAHPLKLGGRRGAAGPVTLHVVGAHRVLHRPSATIYTPVDIKTVSRWRGVPP